MHSVHLEDFPVLKHIQVDNDIVAQMDLVRDICNAVFSLRKEANIRVRMPLLKMTICGDCELNKEYLSIIQNEVNVKEIVMYNDNIEDIATMEVVINMKECGKKFGASLKDILQAQKNGDWQIENNTLKIAGFTLDNTLFSVIYKPKDGSKAMLCSNHNVLVMIDLNTTDELVLEGLSRDLIRLIQQTRKDNGFEIADRITTNIYTNDEVFDEILKVWGNFIKEQTLSNDIVVKSINAYEGKEFEIEGHKFYLTLVK